MTTEQAGSSPVSPSSRGAVLTVNVVPRAAKTGMERLPDGSIRIRLTAPPVDGAANAALLRFLAEALELPRSRLSIAGGATSRRKRIAIEGADISELNARLRSALSRNL